AEATAFLDVMCGGRLLFGVGRGYRAIELDSLRIPRAERGERLVEAVQAVRTLWADDPAWFEGRFYRFENVSIRPRPIQRPGPPVWIGADTLDSVARVPEIGDAWIASGRHSARSSGRRFPATAGRSSSSVGRSTGCRCSAKCMWPRICGAQRR